MHPIPKCHFVGLRTFRIALYLIISICLPTCWEPNWILNSQRTESSSEIEMQLITSQLLLPAATALHRANNGFLVAMDVVDRSSTTRTMFVVALVFSPSKIAPIDSRELRAQGPSRSSFPIFRQEGIIVRFRCRDVI